MRVLLRISALLPTRFCVFVDAIVFRCGLHYRLVLFGDIDRNQWNSNSLSDDTIGCPFCSLLEEAAHSPDFDLHTCFTIILYLGIYLYKFICLFCYFLKNVKDTGTIPFWG